MNHESSSANNCTFQISHLWFVHVKNAVFLETCFVTFVCFNVRCPAAIRDRHKARFSFPENKRPQHGAREPDWDRRARVTRRREGIQDRHSATLRWDSSLRGKNQDDQPATGCPRFQGHDRVPEGRWFKPRCSHPKIHAAAGPLSKTRNPTPLRGGGGGGIVPH